MVDRNPSNINKSDISKIHKSSVSSHTIQLKDKKEKEKIKIHTFVVAGTTFTVESKYKLIKQIGQGAYGVVCSCKDTSKETNDPFYKVAIKKVPNAFEDLIDAKRILREIKLLKFFNHENIVSLIDVPKPPSKVGFDDIYIITDLMGTDLHRVIYSKQELNDEYVQFFMYQIIRAILYMHSANVIHRDLKPSNILSNADCHVKICDLGLGRGGMPESNDEEDKKNTELNHDNDDNHPLTTYVITRWYRAPEVILSPSEYSKAVDIWSIGCIFAEILGRTPIFPGEHYLDQIQKIISILGSPTDNDLEFITKKEARNFVLNLQKKKGKSFKQLFPTANPVALDLLSKMLVFNPHHRATIEECIKHEYFKGLHDPDEPLCEKSFDWSFDDLTLTKENLQKMIYEESLTYHPDNK